MTSVLTEQRLVIQLQVFIALILCNVGVLFRIRIILGESILGLGFVVVRYTSLELPEGVDRVEDKRHPVGGVDLPCIFQSRINQSQDGAGDVPRVSRLSVIDGRCGGRGIFWTLT